MPSGRVRIATGIYRDAHGFSVVHHERGRPVETRFPLKTPLDRLERWRATKVTQAKSLAPRDRRGSLARDIVRFLKTRKGRPNYKTEKSYLLAWLRVFPHTLRKQIRQAQIEETLAIWRAEGYAEQTLRHRCRILRQLFQYFDGKHAPSPFDEIPLPAKSKPRPVSVSDDLIRAVALELVKHEITRWLHSPKTRARFLVLASTGRRPSELKRAQPGDVDLERRLWFVRTGKGGPSSTLYLNDDMRAAWQLFIQAKAWGPFDVRNFARVLRRCGWPAGVRPYTLRHSTGLALSERGADLGDIQAHLGHADIATTRTYYVPAIDSRRVAVSQLIDGRLGGDAFRAPPPPKTSTTETSTTNSTRGERTSIRATKRAPVR